MGKEVHTLRLKLVYNILNREFCFSGSIESLNSLIGIYASKNHFYQHTGMESRGMQEKIARQFMEFYEEVKTKN